ncbi:hypothetical protein ABGT15_12270 [Flavobacterium enshiense]|uniref:hypothetical protein n=1 Tax=Flavobacterium enshiense TaxID=1341165 RepID=UPI00345D6F5B
MKSLIYFILAIFICSCSNRISPYYASNIYVSQNNHVVNDALQFSHVSYGDVNFIKSKSALTKHLKTNKLPFDNVLVYGKTYVEPFYEYCILENSKKTFKDRRFIQTDTLINGRKFSFIGIITHKHPPQQDINELSKNIRFGSNYNKNLSSIFDVITANKYSNQFYKGYWEIENYPVYSENEKSQKLQLLLTYASFLGKNKNYDKLLNQWGNSNLNDSITAIIKNKSLGSFESVKREILSRTKEEKLVMFNENHFYPNHRILATKLLPELKAQGFTHLALEALDQKKDSTLNLGANVDIQTGFYTREQHFAELIRTAQSLGFQFVAYENFDSEKERENAEAENLYRETFSKNPKAKVLVMAGISHITEKPDRSGKKWMAQLFKEKYGIDPLTFSQTDLNAYRNLTDSVLLLSSHHLGNKFLNTDYKIINNIPFKETLGNYSYTNDAFEKVQLSLYFEDELNSKNEYSKRIPYRSYLLDKKETFFTTLPNKKIRLMLFNEQGETLENKIIN